MGCGYIRIVDFGSSANDESIHHWEGGRPQSVPLRSVKNIRNLVGRGKHSRLEVHIKFKVSIFSRTKINFTNKSKNIFI